jgi:hypothetical protein
MNICNIYCPRNYWGLFLRNMLYVIIYLVILLLSSL